MDQIKSKIYPGLLWGVGSLVVLRVKPEFNTGSHDFYKKIGMLVALVRAGMYVYTLLGSFIEFYYILEFNQILLCNLQK